jgi:hypothetical protein
VKNKLAPPYTEAEFDIMYNEGISNVGSMLDLAMEFDILQKRGSWISYKGSQLAQGRDAAKEALEDRMSGCFVFPGGFAHRVLFFEIRAYTAASRRKNGRSSSSFVLVWPLDAEVAVPIRLTALPAMMTCLSPMGFVSTGD